MQPETVSPQQPVSPVNPVPETSTQATPAFTWPGAFGIYKHSKAAVKFNLAPYLILLALTLILSGPFDKLFKDSALLSLLAQLVIIVLTVVVGIATTLVLFAGARRNTMTIGESFSRANMSLILKYIGVTIVTSSLLLASFIAFVIPFFFVAPRVALAPYFLIDKNLGVLDSIKASWNSSKGNVGKVYGMFGATIVFALPILTIIGIPVAIYLLVMYSAALVIFYQYVTGENLSEIEATPAPVAAVAPTPQDTPPQQ